MKKIAILCMSLLFISMANAQVNTAANADNTSTATETIRAVNADIIGSWVLVEGWFTSDHFVLKDKLTYYKEGHPAFDYLFIQATGNIEAHFYNYNNDKKAMSNFKLSYGGWLIKQDNLQLTLDGWSITKGKFQYRITYKVTRQDKLLTFDKVRVELLVEEKAN